MIPRLEGIRDRAVKAEPLCADGCPSPQCRADRDRAALLAALDAALALHAPDTYGECRSCQDGPGFYWTYPCPTVTAITTALEGTP